MATPPSPAPTVPASPRPGRRGRRALLVFGLVCAGLLAAWQGPSLLRRAGLATAYGARVGCACHFVAGRPLGACRADFEPGMGLVMLSADSTARSVTARIPLLASQTATYRDGPGCQLEPWRE